MNSATRWLQKLLHGRCNSGKWNVKRNRRGIRRKLHRRFEQLEARDLFVVSIGNPTPVVEPGTGFDGVVKVWVQREDGTTGSGTGALLSDGQHIVTAGHVIYGDNIKGNYDPLSNRTITVEFYLPGRIGSASTQYVVPFNGSSVLSAGYDGNLAHGNDLVLLDLGKLAPVGPQGIGAERYDLYSGNPSGQAVTFIGYGRWGQGENGATMTPPSGFGGGIRHIGANKIDVLGWNAPARVLAALGVSSSTSMYMDFDNRVNPTSVPDILSAAKYNTLAIAGSGYGVPGESLPAQGDSGGPSFIDGKIAGITSYEIPAPFNIIEEAIDPSQGSRFGDIEVIEAIRSHRTGINAILSSPKIVSLDLTNQNIPSDSKLELRRTGTSIELYVNWVDAGIAKRSVWFSQPASSITEFRMSGFALDNTNKVEVAADLGIATRILGANSITVDSAMAAVNILVDTKDGYGTMRMAAGAKITTLSYVGIGSLFMDGDTSDAITFSSSIRDQIFIRNFRDITVGNGRGTMGVESPIDIYAAPTTNLVVDDRGDVARRSVGIFRNAVAGLTAYPIMQVGTQNVRTVKIFGSGGGNGFTVENTSPQTTRYDILGGAGNDDYAVLETVSPIYVDGGSGVNSVVLGKRATGGILGQLGTRSMSNIASNIYVTGGIGSTELTLDDTASSDARSVVLGRTTFNTAYPFTISGLSPSAGLVYYASAAISSLLVQTGAGPQNVKVLDTPSRKTDLFGQQVERITTYLKTGAGLSQVYVSGTTGLLDITTSSSLDSIEFGTSQKTLEYLKGDIHVTGLQPGSVRISALDSLSNRTSPIEIATQRFSIPGGTDIDYVNAASLTVVSASPIAVKNSDAGITTSVSSPSTRVYQTSGPLRIESLDRKVQYVEIGSDLGVLDSIQGAISISTYSAATGSRVVLDDYGTSSASEPANVILTNNEFRRPGAATISYADGIKTPFLTVPPKAIATYIGGPRQTAMLVAGNMFQQFAFVAGTELDGLTVSSESNSSLDGINSVAFRGRGGNNAFVLNDSGATLAKTYTASFATMSPASISVGNAKFTYSSVPLVSVTTSSGNSTVNLDRTTPGTLLSFTGGAGTNRVNGPNDVLDTWEVFGPDVTALTVAGQDVGVFNRFGTLGLGSGRNHVQIDPTGSLSGRIIGGSGTNDLTYELWTTNVYANSVTGEATAISGKVSGFSKFTGGSGNDILVGNAAGTVLDGGDGSDILIGGSLPGSLIGGRGSDVLIAGKTLYDANKLQLQKVLANWTTDDDYGVRVNRLLTGNGGPSLNSSSVRSNGGGNQLQGNAVGDVTTNPNELDLFFASSLADTILDYAVDLESLVAIS